MNPLRVVIVALVSAGVAAALTGWILNQQQTSARRAYAYYPAPPSPIAPLGGVAGASPAPLGGDG